MFKIVSYSKARLLYFVFKYCTKPNVLIKLKYEIKYFKAKPKEKSLLSSNQSPTVQKLIYYIHTYVYM